MGVSVCACVCGCVGVLVWVCGCVYASVKEGCTMNGSSIEIQWKLS